MNADGGGIGSRYLMSEWGPQGQPLGGRDRLFLNYRLRNFAFTSTPL